MRPRRWATIVCTGSCDTAQSRSTKVLGRFENRLSVISAAPDVARSRFARAWADVVERSRLSDYVRAGLHLDLSEKYIEFSDRRTTIYQHKPLQIRYLG